MSENQKSRTQRKKQLKQNKNKKQRPIWKVILYTLLFLFMAGFIGVTGVAAYWIVTAPELDSDKLTVAFASTILDQDGEPVAKLQEENRELVKYEDLPDVLIDAVVATEDARFFEHHGIDFRRLGGAVIANIRDGFGSQGASTITHQVVENFFLSNEKKIKFKVQEQWLALKLERQYTKEEIMEMYLNKIFYGNNSFGVVAAAKDYFGVSDLDELTLPQAAILAGLPQRPTAFNPHRNPDLTAERMNTVLDLMVRHGKITAEQADEARDVDITAMLVEPKENSLPYGAFIDQVQAEVEEKLEGINIHTAGLTIKTTLDTEAQEHVEFLLSNAEANPIPYTVDDLNAAIVVLDTRTGGIKAIGGSRKTSSGKSVGTNYALDANLQPGSTNKPLLVYGPAIEFNNMSTYHQINDDKPYELAGTDGAVVRNATRSYAGWVSARTALSNSINVPTMKIFEELDKSDVKDFTEAIGLNPPEQFAATDAIGGGEMSVTPLELAGAYRAFGNAGIHNESYAVTSVEFPDGSTVDLRPEPKAVMKDSTAYMVTDMLKTAITNGTWRGGSLGNLPVAGKTGTTNLSNDEGAGDYWFSGYTTNYTVTAWVGEVLNENGTRVAIPSSVPSNVSQLMFRETMLHVSEGIDSPDFTKPDTVVEATIEAGTNPPMLASEFTPSNKRVTELFVRGTEPQAKSDTFEELPVASRLTSSYDQEADVIHVEWDYDDALDVSFEVTASVDGGPKQLLTTTENKLIEITNPESGVIYTIEVVAVSNNSDSLRSDPAATSITINEVEEIDMPPVSGLQARYIADDDSIEVSWAYDGPEAGFEVSIDGQVRTEVDSYGTILQGPYTPGETYSIQIVAISREDNNMRSQDQSTQITIPDQITEPEDPEIPIEPEEPDGTEDIIEEIEE